MFTVSWESPVISLQNIMRQWSEEGSSVGFWVCLPITGSSSLGLLREINLHELFSSRALSEVLYLCAKLMFSFQMVSSSTESSSNKMLSKPQIPENGDSVCAVCPVFLTVDVMKTHLEEHRTIHNQERAVCRMAPHNLLGFFCGFFFSHWYLLVPHCCSQKCSLLRKKEENSSPKAWGIKPSLFVCSSFSFSLLSLLLPLLLLFQLLLPSPFISCSLPGRGSRFTFPRDGESFPGTAERKRPLLFLISCDSSSFPVPSSLLLEHLRDVLLMGEAHLEGLTCLGLQPGVSRGRGRAGMRVVDGEDTVLGEFTCSWTCFPPQLKPVPLHPRPSCPPTSLSPNF